MAKTRFNWASLLLRFVGALALVLLTYNPDGRFSYFHWFRASLEAQNIEAVLVFSGIILLIGWAVFLRATKLSLGFWGLVLAAAFFGTLIWLTIDLGILPRDSQRTMNYAILVALAGVLATGMSWSHVRKRLSGQADVDEIN